MSSVSSPKPDQPPRLHIVSPQEEQEEQEGQNASSQIDVPRHMVKRLVQIIMCAGVLAVGGEMTGFKCITTPHQAVIVIRAKIKIAALVEKTETLRTYIKGIDVGNVIEDPRVINKKAEEVIGLADEILAILEDIEKSGVRFKPAILMKATERVNQALGYLEGEYAQILYRKAEKYKNPGMWTRNVTAKFVDVKGISSLGMSIKEIRDKARAVKNKLKKLSDRTLDAPTNNAILNIALSIYDMGVEVAYSTKQEEIIEELGKITFGDRGEKCKEIQRQLILIRFLPKGSDDGICKAQTMEAIKQTNRTMELIGKLSIHNKGREVRELQRNLARADYLPSGEADGKYGERTAIAVTKFKALIIQ